MLRKAAGRPKMFSDYNLGVGLRILEQTHEWFILENPSLSTMRRANWRTYFIPILLFGLEWFKLNLEVIRGVLRLCLDWLMP